MQSIGAKNVVLIGMPGVGKSTIGVLLAKAMSGEFVDLDVAIQAREGCRLQDLIDGRGIEAFRALEEQHVLSLDVTHTVIATGGSVVYSEKAMAHLENRGLIVFLDLSLAALTERIQDLDTRGIVREPEQTFADLFADRAPLYERYANVRVPCEGRRHEAIVDAILAKVHT